MINFFFSRRKVEKMTRYGKIYTGGRIVHRVKGRGLPLKGEHKAVAHVEEIAHAIKDGGISEAALKRLEALKPKEINLKRPNIKF